jgi:SAM-dependent MidA family methyltransferase
MQAFEGVVFANELIDAFPVHRVMKMGGELREFYVGLDANNEFEWRTGAISDGRIHDRVQRISSSVLEGQIFEVNLGLEEWLECLSAKLKKGFVVLVDYGFEAEELFSAARPQGSLRAFRQHEFVENLLSEPGRYDITASVNWTAVKQASASLGFRVVEFLSQDKFLLQAGLLDQLQSMIAQTNDEAEKARLSTDAREMILPGGMAEHFQVLVLSRGI